jgi:hypothetical protein
MAREDLPMAADYITSVSAALTGTPYATTLVCMRVSLLAAAALVALVALAVFCGFDLGFFDGH